LPEETEEINERLLKIKFTRNSTLIAITEEKDPKTKTLNFFAYLIKSDEFTGTSTLKKERRILLKTEKPVELHHAHIFERRDGSFVLILSVNRKLLLYSDLKANASE
jgi:stress-induced morphogen